MKKLLIIAVAVLVVLIALSSCSFNTCPTYTKSSMKQYGPKYTYVNAKVNKKVKKTKIW